MITICLRINKGGIGINLAPPPPPTKKYDIIKGFVEDVGCLVGKSIHLSITNFKY